jgi:hypothetical protein
MEKVSRLLLKRDDRSPMGVKRFMNGDLQIQDQDGTIRRIGPAHPDYRLHLHSIPVNVGKARIIGICPILFSVALLGINWRLLVSEGYYYPTLVLIAPVMLLLGILILARPRYAEPVRDEDRRAMGRLMIPLGMLGLAIGGLICYLFGI